MVGADGLEAQPESGGVAVAERPGGVIPGTPSRPVNIDLHTDRDDEAGEIAPVAPKNRQELLEELRKNYAEVLRLVRKVDQHLDDQSERADRLLEIAQDSVDKLACLPDMVEQNKRIADSINNLALSVRESSERNDEITERIAKNTLHHLESAQQQTAAIHQMQASIQRSGEAEREMAKSIGVFKEAVTTMRETDAAREIELAKLVKNGQKWLIISVIACGAAAVGVLMLILQSAG